MSDGDIPKSSADFVLKFVWGTIVFALGFEGIVKLVEGELRTAVWCFVAAAVLSLALVHRVKIAAFMRSNMFAILIALGFAGALALGIAIGGLVGRNGPLAQRPSTAGRIAWSFDQPTANYSLAMSRLNNEEVRIVGFQAHGKNTSPDPITEFTRAMRSDRTNEERPILFLAQETAKEGAPPFGIPAMVPTLPVETYGIPGLADFDVATHESPFIETGKDGVPWSQFVRDFGAFTVVLKYDNITVERHFSVEQIKAEVARLESQSRPLDTSLPRITRRKNAKPVQMFPALPAPELPLKAPDSPTDK